MASPYSLDFLQHITDIHFGGQWLAIGVSASATQGQSLFIDFPSQAGGTPGYRLLNAGGPAAGMVPAPFIPSFPSGVHGWPAVKASYLSQKQHTDAGASLIGWGAAARVALVTQEIVFLECGAGVVSGGKFPASFRVSGAVNDISIFVDFVAKNGMKAGPFPSQFVAGGNQIKAVFPPISSGTQRVIIDPSKLTVVPG